MNRIFITTFCAFFFAACMSADAQKPISRKQWKKTTRVVYTYHSGSAIDPDKRDYSISVDRDSIIVRVSAPDGRRGAMCFESSPEQFGALKKRLEAQGLGLRQEEGAIPVGGSMERIECFAGSVDAYFSAFRTGGEGTLLLKEGEPYDAFSEVLDIPVSEIIRQVAPPLPREENVLVRRITLSEEEWGLVDFVRYSFTDASLPPEYHRSYSIAFSPDSATVAVWSYGEQLLQESYPFTPERFEALRADLMAQGFSSGKPSDEPLPTGGTSEGVGFFCGEKCLFSASAYAGIGTLRVERGGAGSVFSKYLPEPIDNIIDRTRTDR